MATLNLNDLINTQIKIRDKIAEIKQRHKDELAKYTVAQEKITNILMDKMQELGVESLRSESGTAYLNTKTSVSVQDKSAFMDFILSNEAFQLLDVHANKTAVQEYLSDNQELPPGVSVTSVLDVGYRRA